MNKKLSIVLFFLISAGFMGMSTPASATEFETYTVGSLTSTTPKDTFGFDETPFLYMKLPQNEFNVAATFWNSPMGLDYFEGNAPDTTLERWIGLTDWNAKKEVGNWSIKSLVFYADGSTFTNATSLTVTPEPVAMTLFLLGGVPIALSLYRKRKKNILTV